MDDIIFEKDYRKAEDHSTDSAYSAIFDRAIEGGFFKAYADAMDQVPKIIVAEDKANYEYLLDRLDKLAQRRHGRIYGKVDYHKWVSRIEVYLPFLAFEDDDELVLMKEIAEKADAVTVEAHEEGVRLYISIDYFEELMTDAHRSYLELQAIMQDDKLVALLAPQLSEEDQAAIDRLRAILDRFEDETDYDRTTVFQAILAKVMDEDEENQTVERVADLAEVLLEKALSEADDEN